jgi:HAD superfamily hydrolase (TIGR01509 family)
MAMSQSRAFRAAVFDFDGLLADTEPLWEQVEHTMFSSRGLPFGKVQRGWFLGTAVGPSVAIMAEHFGEDPALLRAELNDRALALFRAGVQPMPGALDLIRRVREAVPVAIASNTARALLDECLAASGIAGEVPVVVAGDEVANPKPAPDIYLRACALLGVPAAEAVAFEDSVTGATAARAAGLTLVAVPSVPGSITDAHLVVDSLSDPRVNQLFSAGLHLGGVRGAAL